MLIAKLQCVTSEKDHYKNGCDGEIMENFWKWEIQAENQEKLLSKIASEFYRVSVDNIAVNPCEDEPNRLDVQLTTSEEFSTLASSDRELEEWKQEKRVAFNTCFTFLVFEVKPFTLAQINN